MKGKPLRAFLRRTYRKLFREFLFNSTIHGLKVLLQNTSVRHGRKLWIFFLVAIIAWTHFIIGNLVINFLEQPTEIHMSTNLIHVANSPFPCVAICSVSKISTTKLNNYAAEVFDAQERFRPGILAKNVTEMADHLLILAGFYLFPYDDYKPEDTRLEKLHNILTFMYKTTEYPTREILRQLTPDCDKIIVRGLVFGVPLNTSNLFLKRLTANGVCCAFNYPRESYATTLESKARDISYSATAANIKFQSDSVLNSIHFVLTTVPSEYTFKELSNDAFQVHILPQLDYMPLQSTTMGDVFVDHNTIVEIPIQPTFFGSSESIRQFSPQKRKCYYPEEGQKLINRTYYSMDECLVICRMRSQVKYCGCISPPAAGIQVNGSLCTLLDLPCLTQWKAIWYGWNYFSYAYDDEDDDVIPDTSINEICRHCMPTCDGVIFEISTNELPLRTTENGYYTHGLLKNIDNSRPLAIVKLYFKQRYAQATETEIVSNWVVLLNRFGGIMSLMYGFSVVSYIEILYYLCGKWFMLLCRAVKIKIKRKISAKPQTPQREPTPIANMEYNLYWDELKPKNNLDMFDKDAIMQTYQKI